MATFEMQGPDGKTYQVEAPDMQTAYQALEGQFSTQQGLADADTELRDRQSMQSTALDTNPALRFVDPNAGESFGIGAAQGASLGFIDNIGGAVRAVTGIGQGGTLGSRYAQGRDQARVRIDTARQNHPVATLSGELAGGVATGAAVLPATAGSSVLGTTARTAGVGALEGGLYGAGNADGENVAAQAITGAGLGAGLGMAARPVMQGARAVGRAAGTPLAALAPRGSNSRARAVVNRAFQRSGRSVDDVVDEMRTARTAGQPEFAIADALGAPGQGAMSGVARTPGAGAREISEFLQSRQLNAGDRMSLALSEGLDASDTASQRAAALTARRSDDAGRNYAAAREGAGPVDVRGALGVIDSRIGQIDDAAGTGFQGDGIDSVFSRFRNRLAADRVPSDIDAMEWSDFNRVLGVKQDLADEIGKAVRAGENNKARELGVLQSQLDQALEAASPGYRQANDTFAQQSRTIEAVDQGTRAAMPRTRAADAVDQFSAMNPDQQSAFRAGVGDNLIGRIEGQAPGANVASPLMRDRTATLLDEIATDPAKLRGQIARENTMAETRNRALGGSMTANNLADMDDVQNVDVGMLANLFSGNIGPAAVQGAQKVANVATGRNEATNQIIARMLMSNDPEDVFRQLSAQVGAREARQQIAEVLTRQTGNRAIGDDTRNAGVERIREMMAR